MKASTQLLVGLLALGACRGDERDAPQDERPSLLLLLTDDQRYDTLSCNGSEVLETPNLDRLATEGARFTRAYVTTSLCCPARASLYTGLYAHTHGIRNNEDEADFLRTHPGFPALLQEAGYDTAFIGKWHVHNPGAMPQPGFDRWVSFEGQGQYDDEVFNFDGEQRQVPGFNTDVLFDLAIEWLEAERDAPNLLVLSLKNLHGPYFPPPRHRRVLLDKSFPEPLSFHDDPQTYPLFIQRARGTMRNRLFDEGGPHEAYVRGYHQLVLSVEDNFGRLLASMEKNGALDRTVMVLTSDGGFMWGEHGMYRKRTAYEPSVHVPLLVRYPAEIPAGTELDQLALTVDLMPTLLDLAGVTTPALQHGRSLRGLWRGGAQDWRKDFLYIDGWGKFVDGPQELAVIDERYKLVRYRRDEVENALFDRTTDPDERTNLIDDPAHGATRQRLEAALAARLAEVDAPASWLEAIELGDEDE
ncbi:MAG: sulfatase-like hydrolase/transferase [Planctomycetota bacterium]|nr:sulfatase-like hydrolase/transferase [Planctomycetota bacterium]